MVGCAILDCVRSHLLFTLLLLCASLAGLLRLFLFLARNEQTLRGGQQKAATAGVITCFVLTVILFLALAITVVDLLP